MKEKMALNNSKAGSALMRLRYRGMAAAYDGWKLYWHRSKRIRRLRDGAMARGIVYRFDLWKKYVVMTKVRIKRISAKRTFVKLPTNATLPATRFARRRSSRKSAPQSSTSSAVPCLPRPGSPGSARNALPLSSFSAYGAVVTARSASGP